jgi:hypothetical protein
VTRWFKLTQSTTYEWKSKRSGKYYVFAGDRIVAVDHEGDQERFLRMPNQFVEVDQRGSIIDQQTGQTLPPAFSRKGMVSPPRSYTKIARTSKVEEPPKPEPAPRKIVSSKKAEEQPAPEAMVKPAATQAAPKPKVAKSVAAADAESADSDVRSDSAGAGDAPDSSDGSGDVSKDSAPKKRRKRSSKKKSGRKGDK